MKKFLFASAMLLLCMVSCQKDGGLIYLEVENYTTGDQGNKVHLDNAHFAVWDDGDSININDVVREVMVSDGQAMIREVAQSDRGYWAIYPADPFMILPATQTYRTNGNEQVIKAPMFGMQDEENVLKFRNLASILSVKIENTTGKTMNVQRIEVTDENGDTLSGGWHLNNLQEPVLIMTEEAVSNTVSLDCNGETIASGESKVFHIVLPVVDSARLTIKVYDDYDYYTRTQSERANTSFARNTIHQVTFSTSGISPQQYRIRPNQIWYTSTGTSSVEVASNSLMQQPTTNSYDEQLGCWIMTFPNNVTTIEAAAFKRAYSLKTMMLPEGVTEIGYYAFDSCLNLQQITLPESLVTIQEKAFLNTKLNNVDLPGHLQTIGSMAFARCEQLTAITLPGSLTSIGSEAFWQCSSLARVVVGSGITSLPQSVFSRCSTLTSVTLPTTLTTLEKRAFYNCTGLQNITVPEGVTSIGVECFCSCTSLEEAHLPSTLGDDHAATEGNYNIQNYAFYGCTKLTKVYCAATRVSPKLGTQAFTKVSGSTLYIPQGTDNNVYAGGTNNWYPTYFYGVSRY